MGRRQGEESLPAWQCPLPGPLSLSLSLSLSWTWHQQLPDRMTEGMRGLDLPRPVRDHGTGTLTVGDTLTETHKHYSPTGHSHPSPNTFPQLNLLVCLSVLTTFFTGTDES